MNQLSKEERGRRISEGMKLAWVRRRKEMEDTKKREAMNRHAGNQHDLQKITDAAWEADANMEDKLRRIEALVRQHNTPACNPGAHALAAAVLQIIQEG